MSRASALDEVARRAARDRASVRLAREVVGQVSEIGVEQREQRAEGVLLAAVRRRRDEDEMAARVCGESLERAGGADGARAPGAASTAQVCASSTITSSGQARRKSSRRRSDLMKSVETITCG